MCGRFANPCTAESLEAFFAAATNLLIAKGWKGGRYNAAPTQELPVVLPSPGGGRALDLMRWGWKPSWMKTGLLMNAKGEEAAGKPTYDCAAAWCPLWPSTSGGRAISNPSPTSGQTASRTPLAGSGIRPAPLMVRRPSSCSPLRRTLSSSPATTAWR